LRTPTVVAVVGATATGKSSLGIEAAAALGGEVVSVDSRQIYRGMDIGTAKPSTADRGRVVHHLIDVAEPDDAWSLARYQRAVYALVPEILARERVPILVGGTGQYLRAILDGWAPGPRDPEVRARLEAEARSTGPQTLVDRLARLDPAAAAAIDSRNLRRVIRALEIYSVTGKTSAERPRAVAPGFDAVRIGLTLPRDELYRRVDERIDSMIDRGLIGEVRALLERGYTRDLPSMSAIGYRELAAHLAGEIDLEEAVRQMRRATRRYVRSQANWFRGDDSRIRWFVPSPGYEGEAIDAMRLGLAGA
jgi:tRNA dimethylallyltransferase